MRELKTSDYAGGADRAVLAFVNIKPALVLKLVSSHVKKCIYASQMQNIVRDRSSTAWLGGNMCQQISSRNRKIKIKAMLSVKRPAMSKLHPIHRSGVFVCWCTQLEPLPQADQKYDDAPRDKHDHHWDERAGPPCAPNSQCPNSRCGTMTGPYLVGVVNWPSPCTTKSTARLSLLRPADDPDPPPLPPLPLPVVLCA